MKATALLIPLFIAVILIHATVKRVDVFNAFIGGVKKTLPLIFSLFPYLCAVLIMTELMRESGVNELIAKLFSPVLSLLGVPSELTPLIILKPFSGGGSLALLSEIYLKYGVDSYISRVASVIFSSSETVFYISAIYFSGCKNKRLKKAIAISLFSTLFSCVFASLICRLL